MHAQYNTFLPSTSTGTLFNSTGTSTSAMFASRYKCQ